MAKFKMQKKITTELTFYTFSGIGKIHRRSSKLRVPFSCWLAAAQVYCMYACTCSLGTRLAIIIYTSQVITTLYCARADDGRWTNIWSGGSRACWAGSYAPAYVSEILAGGHRVCRTCSYAAGTAGLVQDNDSHTKPFQSVMRSVCDNTNKNSTLPAYSVRLYYTTSTPFYLH